MGETILLLCTLIIVVPILMGLIALYNMRRTLEGKTAVSGPTALRNMISDLINRAKAQRKEANLSKKQTRSKTNSQKDQDIEDAEFREI